MVWFGMVLCYVTLRYVVLCCISLCYVSYVLFLLFYVSKPSEISKCSELQAVAYDHRDTFKQKAGIAQGKLLSDLTWFDIQTRQLNHSALY